MTETLKVFITDDDTFFASAISIVINAQQDMEVIGQAENGIEAIDKLRHLQPDVVLMDIQMPKMNGIDCLKIVKQQYPALCILILTTFNEEEYIIEGLANGANGYLVKSMNYNVLTETIRDVKNGQYMLPVEVASKLAKFMLHSYRENKPQTEFPSWINVNQFSEKEQKILLLLMKRLSNKEIASEMCHSVGTIRNYLTTIYAKLGVNNRQEAIVLLVKKEE